MEYLPTHWDDLENYINGVNVGVHIPAPWILWEWEDFLGWDVQKYSRLKMANLYMKSTTFWKNDGDIGIEPTISDGCV